MDELLKILFGREPSGMGAFPIPQNPVTVEEIMPGQMPSVTNVTPSVTPAEQSRFRMPDFSGISLPSLPDFNFSMPQGLVGEKDTPEQRAKQGGLLSAAMALLEASGPQPQKISVGQAAGRGLGAYQQGYQTTFDQALKSMQEARSREAMSLVQSRLSGGTPDQAGQQGGLQNLSQFQLLELSATPGLPKDMRDYLIKLADARKARSQDISPEAALYAQSRYGTPNVAELTAEQARDVLSFMSKPSIDQQISLARLQFETGVGIPGLSAQPQQAPVPQATQDQAPSVQVPSFPKEMSGKPLGKNEVPLIQSQGLAPKQKQELQLKKPETIGSVEYAIDQTRQMANTARRLLANPSLERAFGPVGLIESKIPSSPAANILAELDLLRNQSFVQGLQAMRAANTSGGAVGNVSDAEGKRFENLQAALAQIQSGSQARKELERLVKELEGSEERLKNAFERTYGPGTDFNVRPIFEAPPPSPTRGRKSTIKPSDQELIKKHLPR